MIEMNGREKERMKAFFYEIEFKIDMAALFVFVACQSYVDGMFIEFVIGVCVLPLPIKLCLRWLLKRWLLNRGVRP